MKNSDQRGRNDDRRADANAHGGEGEAVIEEITHGRLLEVDAFEPTASPVKEVLRWFVWGYGEGADGRRVAIMAPGPGNKLPSRYRWP